jgi:hypothetical protein
MAKPTDIKKWPVIWRVVAPACGIYDHDMVFLESESEREARARWLTLRRRDWPVRLERVQCGPLPAQAKEKLNEVRVTNGQNEGAPMREIPAYWEGRPHG